MAGLSVTFRITDSAELERAVSPLMARVAAEITADAAARSRVDTGRMRRGWQSKASGRGYYSVLNGTPYVSYHEFGTRKMSAQPMLGPAVAAARARYGGHGSYGGITQRPGGM